MPALANQFDVNATAADWADWRWQLRQQLKTPEDFAKHFALTHEERSAMALTQQRLALGLTPYYANLIDRHNPNDPLRLAFFPQLSELEIHQGETNDPLGETKHTVLPNLVHRYPDRVLFLVNNQCPVYCRYCMRARMVSKPEARVPKSDWDKALDYIRATPEIREVLLSGGEPLMLGDESLKYLLEAISAIPHVDIIRFSTRLPLVLPQRITPELVRIMQNAKPIWLGLHIIHPREFTAEVKDALRLLANVGVVLTSQTPLLKEINDDVEVMRDLMRQMIAARVRPYYLFHCDPMQGNARFRTSIEKGLEIIAGLQGHLSGYAVPHYVVDIAGAGKMPITPQYIIGRDGDYLLMRNFRGDVVHYYDPQISGESSEKVQIAENIFSEAI